MAEAMIQPKKDALKSHYFWCAANIVQAVRMNTTMSKYATQAECRAARDALAKAAETLQTIARMTAPTEAKRWWEFWK